jgi:signal peptidase I
MSTTKKKRLSVPKMLGTVVQVILIVALVGIGILSFGTRIPLLANAGVSFFAVTSGSMEPTIQTGSLLYAGKYHEDDLKKDDIITYFSYDIETNEPSIVTHRIMEVIDEKTVEKFADPETGEDKERTLRKHEFVTQGDANNAPDARTIPVGNVIGLYKFHLPQIGFITAYSQTSQGFLTMVVAPAAILIVWEMYTLISSIKEFYAKKTREEIAKIKAELMKEKNE